MQGHKPFLTQLYQQAVAVSQPAQCLPGYLRQFPADQPICILGAGKAAADMAAVAYAYFDEHCFGAVVTRYGYETLSPTGAIEVLSAAHPVPDHKSLQAGQRLLEVAGSVPEQVPVLCLISGGGSALASVPASGISLDEKIAIHQFLLRSGAAIEEMNTVRKHLSAIKGGRLAAACKGPVTSLVISDVVGDDPSFIASGLTVQDNSQAADALAILQKYHWQPIASIEQHLSQHPAVPRVQSDYQIIANANQAIDAAKNLAEQQGWQTHVLSYTETGEAADVAKLHADIAKAYAKQGQPTLLFSGGELTVTLGKATGEGGPNQEYLMSLALALNGETGICALAADTDGVDGSQDVAGGFIDEHTLAKAKQTGLNVDALAANHDSYRFFDALDQHIKVGPTGTNVNDFRVLMVQAKSSPPLAQA